MHGTFATRVAPHAFIALNPFERNRPLKLKPEAMLRLVQKVVAGGGERLSLYRHRVDWAGKCERPVWFDAYSPGERMPADPIQVPGFAPPRGDPHRKVCVHRVEMAVPCRKCAACLRARCWEWTMRGTEECRACAATWMCTFTIQPDRLYLFKEAARVRLKVQGTNFDQLSKAERFSELAKEVGREFTLYVKRLRRKGAKFRYLAVFEEHKSGEPHMHALMHDHAGVGGLKLSERVLRLEWSERVGFARAKLVREETQAGGVRYATKYIAKDARTRIRSSLGYGKPLAAFLRMMGLRSRLSIASRAFPYVPAAEAANDLGLNVPVIDWREADAEAFAAAEQKRYQQGVWGPVMVPAVAPAGPPNELPCDASWESERVAYYRRLADEAPGVQMDGVSLCIRA